MATAADWLQWICIVAALVWIGLVLWHAFLSEDDE